MILASWKLQNHHTGLWGYSLKCSPFFIFFSRVNCLALISKIFHKGECGQFCHILSKMSAHFCLTVLLLAELLPSPVDNPVGEHCLPPMQGKCSPGKGLAPQTQSNPLEANALCRFWETTECFQKHWRHRHYLSDGNSVKLGQSWEI